MLQYPLGISHTDDLVKDGVGGAATAYETVKKNKYPDIDFSVYDFLPFIVESCGGIGEAALDFCKELEDQREAKEYWKNKEWGGWNLRMFPNPLLTAINIEVQRFNSRMILERQPPSSDLIETSFTKCEAEVAKKKGKAVKIIKQSSNRRLRDSHDTIRNKRVITDSTKAQQIAESGFPIQPWEDKWPPDPPETNKTSNCGVPNDKNSAAEHPLAITNKANSKPMSASTRPSSRLTMIPKGWLRGTNTKDPDAIGWEPPKLTESVELGKITVVCERNV